MFLTFIFVNPNQGTKVAPIVTQAPVAPTTTRPPVPTTTTTTSAPTNPQYNGKSERLKHIIFQN